MEEREKPVKVDDVINEQVCISEGKFGDGIFKFEGFVIATPDTKVGNTYNLKIVRVMEKIAFAEVVE